MIINKKQARKKSATNNHSQLTTHNSPLQPKAAVWKFTNQKELDKSQFIDYVERKVFRTIRKENMLPKNKIITLKKSTTLNTTVLKKILEKKFQVKIIPATSHQPPATNSANLSQIAEDTFKEVLKGNFKKPPATSHQPPAPLLNISDKEVALYAKLTNTKGTKRKQDKKIQSLFDKFLKKNQDLELNVIKASNQLN